jgi:hypothetical protein
MMNIPLKIESEFETLPAYLQAEVLDFVQFVKQRHGLTQGTVHASVGVGLFEALTQSGFIGCVDSNEQLASNYKSQLNFGDTYAYKP